MKIDIFTHIMPEKYLSIYRRKNPAIEKRVEVIRRPVVDLEMRLRLMNRCPDVLQVLTVANVPLETFASREDAIELAAIANDELAELVARYPDKFFAGVACLPMNDIDAALQEADRAITQLRLRGVQIYSRINGEPLDNPKFKPLYEKMAKYDLPIWIHPADNEKLDFDNGIFSWPFETSSAMYRLVRSGVFVDHPKIKFIVHHAGAMVSFFGERIRWITYNHPQPFPDIHEHYKNFYGDTAMYGSTAALMCAYEYFGADHLLFGTDAPLGPWWGMVQDTVDSIERMPISDVEKQKILKQNAVSMFKMTI